MVAEQDKPKLLYKYRPFNNFTLEMLVEDQLFFADPSTFNDPLDTKPNLKIDCSVDDLELAVRKLISTRSRAELMAAAQTIKYRGPRTVDHIEKLVQLQERRIIDDARYNATDPFYEEENIEEPYTMLLGHHLEDELLRQYDKGIVSLAERAICPLMWSHYGDQHRGICIGYSVPDDVARDVHQVLYGGERFVFASDVTEMAKGSEVARRRVDAAVLFRKAEDWRYEREWRFIGPRGLRDSLLELEEVTFGVRCKDPVRHAVIAALESRSRPVRFFEMREIWGTFELTKYEFDNQENGGYFPRRSRGMYEAFQSIAEAPGADREV